MEEIVGQGGGRITYPCYNTMDVKTSLSAIVGFVKSNTRLTCTDHVLAIRFTSLHTQNEIFMLMERNMFPFLSECILLATYEHL